MGSMAGLAEWATRGPVVLPTVVQVMTTEVDELSLSVKTSSVVVLAMPLVMPLCWGQEKPAATVRPYLMEVLLMGTRVPVLFLQKCQVPSRYHHWLVLALEVVRVRVATKRKPQKMAPLEAIRLSALFQRCSKSLLQKPMLISVRCLIPVVGRALAPDVRVVAEEVQQAIGVRFHRLPSRVVVFLPIRLSNSALVGVWHRITMFD